MSRDRQSNGDAYDPEKFVRGAVAEDSRGGRDKAGRAAKHQVFGVRLITAGGYVGMPYGFLRGLPWMAGDKTRIEMMVEGYHRDGGAWKLGLWLVIVVGTGLEPVFDQICLGKREWLHAGGSDGDEPFVESVVITLHEEL